MNLTIAYKMLHNFDAASYFSNTFENGCCIFLNIYSFFKEVFNQLQRLVATIVIKLISIFLYPFKNVLQKLKRTVNKYEK